MWGQGQPSDQARSQCLWGPGAAKEEKEQKEEEEKGRTLAQPATTAGAREAAPGSQRPPGRPWVFPVLLLTSGGNPAALRGAAVGKGREEP